MSDHPHESNSIGRRDFIKGSAGLGAAALASQVKVPGAHAASSDKLRVGLIGCGNRGTMDARKLLNAEPNMELYAMGDLFEKNRGRSRRMGMNQGYEYLQQHVSDKMNVPKERRFVGWDASQKVIDSEVDIVMLTTPPHFRPMQFKAAIEGGKHVFMEKPAAVDPVGCRTVAETAKKAKEKNLGVLAGTQMRHRQDYIGVMQRIHDGWIGDLVAGQAYYNYNGVSWHSERASDMSDMEWQIRNWYYFDWLSGDFIVEQDVHKIDILNWAFGGPPKQALAMGGRGHRSGKEDGNIFDHFTVEYEYPNEARVMNMCQHIPGSTATRGERLIGTKGKALPTGGYGLRIEGAKTWEDQSNGPGAVTQEFRDLITSIRDGSPINDGERIANSTLTAIMGRMAAYTARSISWDWLRHKSQLDLGPDEYKFGKFEPRPVAVPGDRELV